MKTRLLYNVNEMRHEGNKTIKMTDNKFVQVDTPVPTPASKPPNLRKITKKSW
jgi:hypothetical protein